MAYVDGTLINVSGHENDLLGRTWQYRNAVDNVAVIAASAFLNPAAALFRQGDVIDIRGANGTAIARISSVTGATPVTVAAFTALV
jgi:hypothetical protein